MCSPLQEVWSRALTCLSFPRSPQLFPPPSLPLLASAGAPHLPASKRHPSTPIPNLPSSAGERWRWQWRWGWGWGGQQAQCSACFSGTTAAIHTGFRIGASEGKEKREGKEDKKPSVRKTASSLQVSPSLPLLQFALLKFYDCQVIEVMVVAACYVISCRVRCKS